jgi:methyl-accepting chemotaxis protein
MIYLDLAKIRMEVPMRKLKFDFKKMLLMLALIPMLTVAFIMMAVSNESSRNEVQQLSSQSMKSLISGIGDGVDHQIDSCESILKAFSIAPVIADALRNPDDAEKLELAQKYTLEYFSKLDGWEGLYAATWGSKVLTHPTAPPVIGVTLREGDSLKSLQDAMLSADNGIYNAGIIVSPATGDLTISMYVPVLDEQGNPIGYVGAGAFMGPIVSRYDDLSTLELSTAYFYVVDKEGVIIYHPDPEKMGQVIEAEAVIDLVEDVKKGGLPELDVISYEHEGEVMRSAYYIGYDSLYTLLIAANEDEVMNGIETMSKRNYTIVIVLCIVFIIVAIFFERIVVKPLKRIVKELNKIADGDLSGSFKINSVLYECREIIAGVRKLKAELIGVASDLGNGSGTLSESMSTVTKAVTTCNDAAANITTAIAGLSSGNIHMAKSVTAISTEVNSMGNHIEETDRLTIQTKTRADNMSKISRESQELLRDLISANESTTESATEVIHSVNETNKAIELITEAAKSITDIANRTNLLSLNASIEAARAGEAGRGFAVVATEIGKLAKSSGESSTEIQKIINEIIVMSKKSEDSAAAIGKSIEHEKDALKSVNSVFTEVISGTNHMTEDVSAIAVKINAIADEKDTVLDAVGTLSSIAQENAASTQETNATIEKMAANIENIHTQVLKVNDVTSGLGETASKFNL